jgi:DNA-binding MarR family transcriptional regulator
MGSNVLKEDSRRSKMSPVPARIAKGRGDGFGLSMAEIARHIGVTTSGIAKAVARLEEEG